MSRVEEAIHTSQARGEPHVAHIIAAVEHSPMALYPPLLTPPHLAAVAVPIPDLSRFNQLLSHSSKGDDADEWRNDAAAVARQPQAVEAADDAR
jgi:hypothetical protein